MFDYCDNNLKALRLLPATAVLASQASIDDTHGERLQWRLGGRFLRASHLSGVSVAT